MAFDPDSYLSSKSSQASSGFDPDAYIAQMTTNQGGGDASQKPMDFFDTTNALANRAFNSALMNFGDEALGGTAKLLGANPTRVDQKIKEDEDARAQVQKEHPWLSAGADIIGGIPTMAAIPFSKIGQAVKGASYIPELVKPAAALAAEGATIGGIYGAGENGSLKDRAKSALNNAEMGAAVGVAVPAATKVVGGAINAVGDIAQSSGVKDAIGNIIGRIAGITPESVNEQAIEGAKALDIQLPLSAQTKNNLLRFTENVAGGSGLGGKSFSNQVGKLNKSAMDAYSNILDRVSPNEIESPSDLGTSVQAAIERAQQDTKSGIKALYDKATELLPKDAYADSSNITQTIDSNLQKLSKTALPSTEEKFVINTLQDLKNTFNGKDVPVETMVATKRSLNDMINWDLQGGSKQMLKQVVGSLKQDIAAYGETAEGKPFYQEYLNAEKTFGQNADTLQSRVAKFALNGQDPSYVLNKITTPEDAVKLKALLGDSENGKQLYQDVARAKVQQILDQKVIKGAMTDEPAFSFANFVSKLDPSPTNKTTELIKNLVGDDQFNRLMQLRNVAAGVQGGSKFINTSKTATHAIPAIAAFETIKGMAGGGLPSVIGGIATLTSPYVIGKVITNPEIVQGIINTAKASAGNNLGNYISSSNALKNALVNAGLGQLINKGDQNAANQ